MKARKLVLAGVGGILVLAIVLLLARGGEDDRVVPVGERAPAGEVAAGAGDVGDAGGIADSIPDGSSDGPAPIDSRPAGGGVSGSPGTAGADPAVEEPVARPLTVPPPEEEPVSDADATPGGGSDAPAPGSSEVAPRQEIEDILHATARRYEGVRSLRTDFQQRLANTLLGRTTESAGTIYQRQPDGFRMQFSDPAGDLIVSDGEFFWLYYPSVDPRQVIRTERGAGGLDLRSQFVGDPVERFEATSQGRETVRGRVTHVLTLTPREPLGYRRLKVWIDAEDHLVRRFELTEENGNVRFFDLTDLRVNPTLEDALFEFEPPSGAVIVTR